jgi:hypothetical protein
MKQQRQIDLKFYKAILASLSVVFLFVGFAPKTQAQDKYEPPPLPVDPTPLVQLLSETEKAWLARETNTKKLVETYLNISNSHLQVALSAINNDDFKTSERELDIYNKSLTEAAKLAFTHQNDKRKLAKKVEQTIYKQLKTLETIDRRFPIERSGFIEFAIKHAKQIRGKALNLSFDSGEVITDPDKETSSKIPPQDKESFFYQSSTFINRKALGDKNTFRQTAIRVSYWRDVKATNFAQSDDYLTEEEDDFVRLAQEPDQRIKVFMKIIDRRLKALTGETLAAEDKKAQKNLEEENRKWGVLPKLDRVGYLKHYILAIDEAMAKLEDAYERNPKATTLTKALKNLLESTNEHLKIFHSLESLVKTEQEKSLLSDAIEKATLAHKGAEDGLKPKSEE